MSWCSREEEYLHMTIAVTYQLPTQTLICFDKKEKTVVAVALSKVMRSILMTQLPSPTFTSANFLLEHQSANRRYHKVHKILFTIL